MGHIPYSENEPFILTVAGGKGGTGKSFISANMAILYAQAGLRVILIDHDLGAANLQTLFGMHQSDREDGEFFTRTHSKLESFLMEPGIPNLLLIPGNSFGLDFTNINTANKVKFFNHIRTINTADIVIIDLGGGTAEQTLDIFLMGHAGLVVSSTEPTSILSTYEFLKNAIYRTIYRMFKGQEHLRGIIESILASSNTKESLTIHDIANQIAEQDQWAAQMVTEVCNDFDFYAILNQARSPEEAKLGLKLHSACEKYLGIDLNFAGVLFFNDEIPAQVHKLVPMSITHPDSITCQTLKRMSAFILKHMSYKLMGGGHASTFQQQMLHAVQYAKMDFPKNRINRKSIYRESIL